MMDNSTHRRLQILSIMKIRSWYIVEMKAIERYMEFKEELSSVLSFYRPIKVTVTDCGFNGRTWQLGT